MAAKKIRNVISHKKLTELLKKHKRIKVVIAEKDKPTETSRERILTSKGSSTVRYFEQRYRRRRNGEWIWRNGERVPDGIKPSRYCRSCFQSYIDDPWDRIDSIHNMRNKAAAIVAAMKRHDGRYYLITAVYAGNKFKKKLA